MEIIMQILNPDIHDVKEIRLPCGETICMQKNNNNNNECPILIFEAEDWEVSEAQMIQLGFTPR